MSDPISGKYYTADHSHSQTNTTMQGSNSVGSVEPDGVFSLVVDKPSLTHTQPGSVGDTDGSAMPMWEIDPVTGFVKSTVIVNSKPV